MNYYYQRIPASWVWIRGEDGSRLIYHDPQRVIRFTGVPDRLVADIMEGI